MVSLAKVNLRKKDLRNLAQSKDLNNVTPALVLEIDLSFNAVDKLGGLEKFTALKTLILDHNSLTSTDSFPAMEKLEVLSLAYNNLKDVNQTMVAFS